MLEAVIGQQIDQESLLRECGEGCHIVFVVLCEPRRMLQATFSELFILEFVSYLEGAYFQDFRTQAIGSGLGMRFVLPNHESRDVAIELKHPAFAVLAPTLIKPRVESWIVNTQACENGMRLIDLICLTLGDIR